MTREPDVWSNGRHDDRRYRRLLAIASAALFWEQLWLRLWPAACVLGAFLALALLDLLPALPDWLHVGVLALFACGFIASLLWARPGFRKIRREAARSRLERDNDLVNRPLAALEDRLAAGRHDRLAEVLWSRHQARMAAMVERLRVRLPRPGVARYDPWGLRAGVLLMLVVGFVAAGRDAGPRLWRSVDPGLGAGRLPPVIELWITPPAYTGVAPMFFTIGGARPAEAQAADASAAGARSGIPVPSGSAALVRAGGVGRAPVLAIGSAETQFSLLASDVDGKQAWRAETTIDQGDRILVRAGRHALAEWSIHVVPDSPPVAAFAEPPAEEGNGLLSIGYAAKDDYGITDLTAVMEAADDQARAVADGKALRVELSLTAPGASSVSGQGLYDLSDHALAGLPVRLYLEAKDAAGQTGRGESIDIVLPERSFVHPVARAIVALRKRLQDPDERGSVADGLAALALQPDEFGKDTVVSLALAVGSSRLRLDHGAGAIPSVRDLLWETALRVEQGDVPFAERRLEEARQRLMEALQRGAGQAEIERLMNELQEALDRYLAAAAAELARRGEIPPPVDRQSRILRADDLKDLIEMARQLSRTGGREGAMQMLAQLQRMIDSIRSGLRSRDAGQELAEARELMDTLRDLSDRQQMLLEQSFQQLRVAGASQQRGPRDGQGQRQRRGQAPAPGAKEGAAEQQALRQELGELMLRMDGFLGGIPAPLGEADQAMRGAVDALGRGHLGDALSNQSEAADALARALDAAGQAMAQRLGRMMGLSGESGQEGGGSGDIFGRSPDGQRGFATGPLAIPEHSELQRAHEILEELRRRAAERFRPRPELDYIDRLLRRF
jgi:uncharacterized protein (TIGR02302 family)